ncbi:MAG: PaaI family thioesterase [Alphaproteobacteria bacterium]|nr:PaaI family thioesterase [Alphaproteobacteria bacterium]
MADAHRENGRGEEDEALLAAGWRAYPRSEGFEGHVGPLHHRRRADGVMVFGFRCRPHHENPQGVVHGGMLMTFADHVMGALVWHRIGRKPTATVSLNSDFLNAVRVGDWVEGTAEIVRQGSSLVFVRGELSVEGRPVLAANGIWKVLGAA